jgi:hypothetical protein
VFSINIDGEHDVQAAIKHAHTVLPEREREQLHAIPGSLAFLSSKGVCGKSKTPTDYLNLLIEDENIFLRSELLRAQQTPEQAYMRCNVPATAQKELTGLRDTVALSDLHGLTLNMEPVTRNGKRVPIPTKIEELSEFPTPLNFLKNYVAYNKPFIVRGGAKSMPAFNKWNNEYLRNKIGALPVRIRHSLHRDTVFNWGANIKHTTMSMNQFIDKMEAYDEEIKQGFDHVGSARHLYLSEAPLISKSKPTDLYTLCDDLECPPKFTEVKQLYTNYFYQHFIKYYLFIFLYLCRV